MHVKKKILLRGRLQNCWKTFVLDLVMFQNRQRKKTLQRKKDAKDKSEEKK